MYSSVSFRHSQCYVTLLLLSLKAFLSPQKKTQYPLSNHSISPAPFSRGNHELLLLCRLISSGYFTEVESYFVNFVTISLIIFTRFIHSVVCITPSCLWLNNAPLFYIPHFIFPSMGIWFAFSFCLKTVNGAAMSICVQAFESRFLMIFNHF